MWHLSLNHVPIMHAIAWLYFGCVISLFYWYIQETLLNNIHMVILFSYHFMFTSPLIFTATLPFTGVQKLSL